MANLIAIRDTIRAQFVANTVLRTLYALNPALTFAEQFSSASIEAAFIDVAAYVSYTLQSVFEVHQTEVQSIIDNQKPHRLRWYRNKALSFRYGQALMPDTDTYSNYGLTEQQIEAAQVVKFAAAIETEDGSGIPILRIKTAGTAGAQLIPLTAPQLTALSAYFGEVKDAGVKLKCTTGLPDSFRSTVEVYYDPLVLDSNGLLLSGGGEPVRIASDSYLQSLPFNGEFSIMAFTDALQQANGAVLVQTQIAQARYGVLPYANIGVRYLPDAGYMRVYDPADLTIIYTPYTSS